MRRLLAISLGFAVIALTAAWISDKALADISRCDSSNAQCLQAHFYLACYRRNGATIDTCTEWLDTLRQRPDIELPDVMVVLGYTYRAMAGYADTREDFWAYRDRAADVFRQVVERDRANQQALSWLSSYLTSEEERLDYLRRRAETVDPSDLFAVRAVVAALRTRLDRNDLFTAIDLQERAWLAADLSSPVARLDLAVSLQFTYRQLAGYLASTDPQQVQEVERHLAEFTDQVREDLGVDPMLDQIREAPERDPAFTANSLELLCADSTTSVIGAQHCIEAIDGTVAWASRSGRTAAALQLADVIATTMTTIRRGSGLRIRAEFPDWRGRLLAHLHGLISAGVETGLVYSTYAAYERDPDARLVALQHASAQFPTDAHVAISLGMEYLWRERRDEAIDQFLIARDAPQPDPAGSADWWLSVARGEESVWFGFDMEMQGLVQ